METKTETATVFQFGRTENQFDVVLPATVVVFSQWLEYGQVVGHTDRYVLQPGQIFGVPSNATYRIERG